MTEKLGYSELVFASKRIFKSDVKKDRNLIESRKADLIFEFEQERRKDATHFRSSGMNQVIAKLMKEKKVSYGLSFNQVLVASKEEKAKIIGRLIQNIKLCKKYKVPVVVASFARSPKEMRDYKDLMAFSRLLGL